MTPRGVTIEDKTRVLVESDDNPEGQGPRLAILGADDWYVSVVREGQLHSFDAVRFCTSGERSSARTMTIALLDAVCRGDIERIHTRAAAVVELAQLELGLDVPESAGAAQPVVEPRDERGVEPAYRRALDYIDEQLREAECLPSLQRDVDAARLIHRSIEACKYLKHPEWSERFSYAPHPSGTEGPLRELLAWIESDAFNEEYEGADEDGSATIARRIRSMLAASPPDGTAPERAHPPSEYFARQDNFLCGEIRKGGWKAQGTSHADAVAKCWAHLHATRPPDGMPETNEREHDEDSHSSAGNRSSDSSPHGDAAVHGRHRRAAASASSHDHATARPVVVRADAGGQQDGRGVSTEPADADAVGPAADGMPGEPARPRQPCSRRMHDGSACGDRALGFVMVPGDSLSFALQRPRCRAHLPEGYHMVLPFDAEPAAPPTVPGEPPWACESCGAELDEKTNPPHPIGNFCRGEHKGPPTPERAPLDEAAVRADERRRTERDIAEALRLSYLNHPDIQSRGAIAVERILDSDYPRRSEGESR